MRDSVVFYRSFYEAIKAEKDPEKRLQAYEAIMDYALDEIEPENLEGIPAVVFIMARPQIDANAVKKENGKRGGAPANNKNASKQPLVDFENNHRLIKKQPNVNVNEKENVNVNENVKVNEPEKQPPIDYLNQYLEAYPKKSKNILTVSEAFETETQTVATLKPESLITAAKNYAEAMRIQHTEERYIKNPDRFIKDATYMDYLSENYKKPRAAPGKKNAFIEADQQQYNFDDIEKRMLAN